MPILSKLPFISKLASLPSVPPFAKMAIFWPVAPNGEVKRVKNPKSSLTANCLAASVLTMACVTAWVVVAPAVALVGGAEAWATAAVALAAGAAAGSVASASPSLAGAVVEPVVEFEAAAKIYCGVGMNLGVPPGATCTVWPGLLIRVRSIPCKSLAVTLCAPVRV